MADEIKQDILLSVKADTGDAGAGIDGIKSKLNDVNNTPLDKPFKSFRADIADARNQAKLMFDEFGAGSRQYTDAVQKVAVLRHEFDEFNKSVQAFNPANKLQALVTVGRGAVGTLEGVAGGMALISGESEKAEETIKRLQGLMALAGALTAVDEVSKGFSNLTAVLKSGILNAYQSLNKFITQGTVATASNTVATTENIAATEGDAAAKIEGAVATEALTVATTEASIATQVFRTALLATGIGAIIVLIGALISNWKEVKEAVGILSEEQEEYNKTLEDFRKGASSAAEGLDLVKEGFDLAKQGVISKDEALKKYNDTLGDALGETDSLAQAEKNVIDKAGAYIQITGLKAQANALFAKSAEATATALTANNEDQVGVFSKIRASIMKSFEFYDEADSLIAKKQAEGVSEITEKATKNSKTLSDQADALLKKAADLGKQFGIKGNVLDNKDDKDDDSSDEQEKNLEKLRQLIADASAAELTANQQKLKELEDQYVLAQNKTAQDIIDFGNARAILEEKIDDDSAKAHEARQDLINKQDEDNKKAASAKLIKDSQDAYQKQEEALLQSLVNGEINQKQYQQQALQDSINSDKILLQSKDLTAVDRQRITKELLQNELKLEQDANAAKVQAINDGADAEKIAVANQYAQGIIDESAYNQKILDIDAEKNAQLEKQAQKSGLAINTFNKNTADTNVKIATLEKDRKKQILDLIGQDLGTLSDLVGSQTVAGKAFAVASAGISTYSTAQKAYESAFLPYPTAASPELGAIAAASAVLTGLNNIRQILAINVPGKGSGGGGSVPSASFTPPSLAPNINAAATQPQNIQDVRVTNPANNNQPLRAYIVNQDLQNNQQRQQFLSSVSNF